MHTLAKSSYNDRISLIMKKRQVIWMEKIYDTVIIGSGPAGLAAAIYGRRAELDLVVIEKELASGGQV